MGLIFLQNELTAFALIEMSHLGVPSLQLLEVMQNRFPRTRKIHLRVEMCVDIKVVTQ
jgi:hypothetical protein